MRKIRQKKLYFFNENGKAHLDIHILNKLFNFGANTVRTSGLSYAYDKGWFTIEDCLNGSETEFKKFLERGQDTLYSLDWNYSQFSNGVSTRQYATLVNDAENKAIMMSRIKDIVFDLDHEFTFKIPVYKNISTYQNEPCAAFIDPNS